MYPVRSRKKAAMASHYAWYCYDLYLLTFPGVRDVFPIITLRRLLINTDLLPQYGQTVVILTCSSLNHDSSMQTIRNGLSDGPIASAGNRAYMQSLISLALFICRIFPIDDSIGDSLLGFPDRHYFLAFSDIKPHGLDESFSRFFGFIYFKFFFSILLASIRWKGI